MIAAIACWMALTDPYKVGQKWQYVLTWHYTNKEINSTDEESFDVEVTKVFPESVTLKISQKLTATLFDGNRIPTDPKAVPAVSQWALSPTGSVAFMPNGRFGLENRFYRILKGILPAPKGDPDRDKTWVIEYPDDGQGMPQSRLRGLLTKSGDLWKEFTLAYREKDGTNGIGKFVRLDKQVFPSRLEVKFTNTKMPGGTDVVDCDFKMAPKAEK